MNYLVDMGLAYTEYIAADAACQNCGWRGKATGLKYGEYYPESHLCDLDCPNCGEHVTFVSFPTGYYPPSKEKD